MTAPRMWCEECRARTTVVRERTRAGGYVAVCGRCSDYFVCGECGHGPVSPSGSCDRCEGRL